jgi:hypothetical protein
VKLRKEGEPEETVKVSLSTPGHNKRYLYWQEDELQDVLRDLGCTIVSVSHDLHEERDSWLHVLATKQ